MNLRQLFLLFFSINMVLPLCAQIKLSGTVSEWYGGAPGQSPKKRALAGVTVAAGVNLNYNSGQSGTDRVSGKVAAKTSTDSSGNYTFNLPAGSYTVLYWKAGYTPQTEFSVKAPGTRSVEISADKSMQGMHRNLSFQ